MGRGRKCGDPQAQNAAPSALPQERINSQENTVSSQGGQRKEVNRKHALRNETCLTRSSEVSDQGPESPPELRGESSSLRSPTVTGEGRGWGVGWKEYRGFEGREKQDYECKSQAGGGDEQRAGGPSEDAVHPERGMGSPLHPWDK